jgi:manganese/zinc/iron transport system permease protein
VAIDALRSTGLVASDAAIALVFPALFALGVLGVHRYTANIHLDLDSTIYGEIAFSPFRVVEIGGFEIARSILILAIISALNLALIALLWKELKVTSFDPLYARVNGFSPRLVSRVLLVAVAITAVAAFESVGAILVIALLIVPAAAAHLLTDRLWAMVALSVLIGWISAAGGYWGAIQLDVSIAGAMGVAATVVFALALLASPRYGLIVRRLRRRIVPAPLA